MIRQLYTWTAGGELVPDRHDGAGADLLVADSWLVDSGKVRGVDGHRSRFFGSCVDVAGLDRDLLDAFWAAVTALLPLEDRWFPRVELTRAGGAEADAAGGPVRLGLRLRPAPPGSPSVAVWVADVPDPRRRPRCKGPDLAALARLRESAAARGAQEALLTTADGLVLEAAGAAVVWWEGADVCLPAPQLPTLPSVTSGLIQERAAATGVPVRFRRRRLIDLDGREVWLVNALHGIRPVIAWIGAAVAPAPPRQAGAWQAWLRDSALPLPRRAAARPP